MVDQKDAVTGGGQGAHGDEGPREPVHEHAPYVPYNPGKPPQEAADEFLEVMRRRRSIRSFSDRPVSEQLIQTLVSTAATAPSGANKQPWRFVAISNPEIKRQIRMAAEEEERAFYERRATPQWLADLAPLGTDASKPFLEVAPWLIVVFKLLKSVPGSAMEHAGVYYVNESVGIATGMLITAIHQAGLVTLTHTPSPMGFLGRILHRPEYERPFLLLPVGYPADDATVPVIARKPLNQVLNFEL